LARIVCAAGVAVGLAAVPVATAQADAGTEDCLFVRPFVGPPTSQLNISGCGFWPGEGVEVYLGSSLRARTTTDGRGNFFTTLNVPADSGIGYQNVTAVGLASGRFARTTFLVQNHP
jgi:hypothetical protein